MKIITISRETVHSGRLGPAAVDLVAFAAERRWVRAHDDMV
jgi:hypothetical protein